MHRTSECDYSCKIIIQGVNLLSAFYKRYPWMTELTFHRSGLYHRPPATFDTDQNQEIATLCSCFRCSETMLWSVQGLPLGYLYLSSGSILGKPQKGPYFFLRRLQLFPLLHRYVLLWKGLPVNTEEAPLSKLLKIKLHRTREHTLGSNPALTGESH